MVSTWLVKGLMTDSVLESSLQIKTRSLPPDAANRDSAATAQLWFSALIVTYVSVPMDTAKNPRRVNAIPLFSTVSQ